jgi:hypothetical protein
LFKLFSFAAVRRERIGDDKLAKFDPQSVPMIAIGRCSNSNGLIFYNPASGMTVSSIDYVLQPNVTSGARFGYKYQPGTFIFYLDESTTVFEPKFPLESKVLVHTHSLPHVATIVGLPSYSCPGIYTVSFADGSLAEYSSAGTVLEALPVSPPDITSSSNLLPSWI